MKKIILICTVLAFISCSSSSSLEPEEPECKSCPYEINGGIGNLSVCDNKDGTATVQLPGETPQIVPLNGLSFADYLNNLREQGIADCP